MFNKKNDALKIAGIVLGAAAGAAALVISAMKVYEKQKIRKYQAQDIYQNIACEDCPVVDECACHGEYASECWNGNCVLCDSCECVECAAQQFNEEDGIK